jgi:hypothetical protein
MRQSWKMRQQNIASVSSWKQNIAATGVNAMKTVLGDRGHFGAQQIGGFLVQQLCYKYTLY